jgi:hypothetical protein
MLATEGDSHGDTSRANESLPGTGAPRASEIHAISVSADDLSVIAESGYEGAASTDQDCRSQAISRFISDTRLSRPHRLKRCCSARLGRHTGVAAQLLYRHTSVAAQPQKP